MMRSDEILAWLRETDPKQLEQLWQMADEARRQNVGDEVHLRALVEISNHCVRLCTYCGLRAANANVERYRMTEDEILECAHQAVALGLGTIVLQSGEDPHNTRHSVYELVRRIKAETPLAVTLSLGERLPEEFAMWRRAGADRYLLKFETSNRRLYRLIHPSRQAAAHDRLALLRVLRRLGFEMGAGVMIGIPGQSYDDLVRDVGLFHALDLDMIGVGPYVPHPATPLAQGLPGFPLAKDQQVPNSDLMTHKVIALTRLMCPRTNIPATTALATAAGEEGHRLALMRGANVIMPNFTPERFRRLYEIYPGKHDVTETPEACVDRLHTQLESIGRRLGKGCGVSPNYDLRHKTPGR